ncbi:MAG: hypothetical protein QXG10_03865 [Candidatus Hadarchaeales archaeon]
MREPLDPFASVGVSNVFFKLVAGRSTPKEISDALEDQQPPSVVENLNRLRDIGLIEREEKIGKTQPYSINWKKFADEFLNHAYAPKVLESAVKNEGDPERRGELERTRESMREVFDALRKNRTFRELLRHYYEYLIEEMDNGLYPRRTIWGSIYCFEESLGSADLRAGKAVRREVKELIDLLEKWGEGIRILGNGPATAIEEAVKRIGETAGQER